MPRGPRRTALAAVAVLVASLAAAGCQDPSRGESQPDLPGVTGSAQPGGQTGGQTGRKPRPSGPTLDPAHAVAPPGPRTGVVGYPDIVVTDADTLGPGTVAAISALPGVRDVLPISLAQVVVQNRAIQVAAVDPETYRNYTLRAVAESQAIWERVAAGELAIDRRVARRLPFDEHGFVALGTTDDAPAVHLGAYAAQAPLIDAVVNETWIPDLGMTPDNALLIRTGGQAPAALRGPIRRALAGSRSSVQMTDVVAREGLDPNVVQTAVVVGTVADAVGTYRYSVLGGGRIAPDPGWVASHITTEPVPILGSVTCNRLIIPQLRAALEEVVERGLADKIRPEEYAGCYYPRFIAGSTQLSNHAFGLALDLNVPGNQRGTAGEIDRSVVAIFERWGFAWGGRWRWTDPMHFEMARLVAPR